MNPSCTLSSGIALFRLALKFFVSGQKVEVKISLQRLSESGDIFEARFVDTNINSTLSLGRVCTNSILPINQSIMSLFPYDQIIITNPKEV